MNKLESLYLLCAMFCHNWPGGYGGKYFQILSMYFRYFLFLEIGPDPSFQPDFLMSAVSVLNVSIISLW